jgi:hypothetical protein
VNPYLKTIEFLGLQQDTSQGDWAATFLLLKSLGDPFTDSAGNVHVGNPPKEVLRRLLAAGYGTSFFYKRLEALLNPAVIAHDSQR